MKSLFYHTFSTKSILHDKLCKTWSAGRAMALGTLAIQLATSMLLVTGNTAPTSRMASSLHDHSEWRGRLESFATSLDGNVDQEQADEARMPNFAR